MAPSSATGMITGTGTRVIVVCNEQPGVRMAGPAIRAVNLAHQLANSGLAVTLAAPEPPHEDLGIPIVSFGSPNPQRFRQLARECDVIITQPQRVDVAAGLHRGGATVIYDCYVPSFVEYPMAMATEPLSARARAKLIERNQLEYATAIECGDAFVVASSRQRDYVIGALGQAGRLMATQATPEVAVVPFGLSPQPPRRTDSPAIKGRLVPSDAVVALWTGGLWNWFDPATVLAGLATARVEDPRLRLVFMASGHPSAGFQGRMAAEALFQTSAARQLVADGAVVFADEWIPYDSRGEFLLDADIGVCAFYDSLETHMSFRTRFLDHLWAGLPTITTAGGVLSDALCDAGAAVCVPPGDVSGWAQAFAALSRDGERRAEMGAAARELGTQFAWPLAAAPLVELVTAQVAATGAGGSRPRHRPGVGQVTKYLAVAVENRVRRG